VSRGRGWSAHESSALSKGRLLLFKAQITSIGKKVSIRSPLESIESHFSHCFSKKIFFFFS
jgi:hypothetical protein